MSALRHTTATPKLDDNIVIFGKEMTVAEGLNLCGKSLVAVASYGRRHFVSFHDALVHMIMSEEAPEEDIIPLEGADIPVGILEELGPLEAWA